MPVFKLEVDSQCLGQVITKANFVVHLQHRSEKSFSGPAISQNNWTVNKYLSLWQNQVLIRKFFSVWESRLTLTPSHWKKTAASHVLWSKADLFFQINALFAIKREKSVGKMIGQVLVILVIAKFRSKQTSRRDFYSFQCCCKDSWREGENRAFWILADRLQSEYKSSSGGATECDRQFLHWNTFRHRSIENGVWDDRFLQALSKSIPCP